MHSLVVSYKRAGLFLNQFLFKPLRVLPSLLLRVLFPFTAQNCSVLWIFIRFLLDAACLYTKAAGVDVSFFFQADVSCSYVSFIPNRPKLFRPKVTLPTDTDRKVRIYITRYSTWCRKYVIHSILYLCQEDRRLWQSVWFSFR